MAPCARPALPSPAAEAAIHQQVHPRHETCRIGQEKDRKPHHLIDPGHPLHRCLFLEQFRLMHHLGPAVHRE